MWPPGQRWWAANHYTPSVWSDVFWHNKVSFLNSGLKVLVKTKDFLFCILALHF